MKKIILASTSPRRKQLLDELGIVFDIVSPDYDECIINKPFSYDLTEQTAINKAESVKLKINVSSVIIAADTVVVFDNIILGKPKNYDEAMKILCRLSDNTHKVVTSVCITDKDTNNQIVRSETSEVTFNKIKTEEIEKYIKEFQPFDKAGAYGIQEIPSHFIKEIKGEYSNIVGLPLKIVERMLKEITKI